MLASASAIAEHTPVSTPACSDFLVQVVDMLLKYVTTVQLS